MKCFLSLLQWNGTEQPFRFNNIATEQMEMEFFLWATIHNIHVYQSYMYIHVCTCMYILYMHHVHTCMYILYILYMHM